MNRAQFHREQLRQARERELQMLAASRANADAHYVADAVEWAWSQVLERKLRREPISLRERQRMQALASLYTPPCSMNASAMSSPLPAESLACS